MRDNWVITWAPYPPLSNSYNVLLPEVAIFCAVMILVNTMVIAWSSSTVTNAGPKPTMACSGATVACCQGWWALVTGFCRGLVSSAISA